MTPCTFVTSTQLDRAIRRSSNSRERTRVGLLGMQERAQLVGADLDIRGAPGTGTQVSVDVAV